MADERALQQIANANGGTRASGTPGFEASAAYVKSQPQEGRLQGHASRRSTFPFFQDLAEPTLSQVSPTRDRTTRPRRYQYSGSGDVTGAGAADRRSCAARRRDAEPSTSGLRGRGLRRLHAPATSR